MASPRVVLDRFGRLPIAMKAAVLAGMLVLTGAGYYFVFFSSLNADKAVLARELVKLLKQESDLQQRKQQYQSLLKQKQELEEGLRSNAVKLPAASELPAFFLHLQAQALAANVNLVKWSRDVEMPIESYVKVPAKMEVSGDFYQITQYFKLLHETPRIITVENLNIQSAKNASYGLLYVTFTASTFRQAVEPPDPNPADPHTTPKTGTTKSQPPAGKKK